MAFIVDAEELKKGLIIFRRGDLRHRSWYCRMRLPNADRYKTVSLKTTDIDAARERAFDQDSDLRFRIKHDVPIFNRPFSHIAKEYIEWQKERAVAKQIEQQRWKNIDSVVRTSLNPYVGNVQITLITPDHWTRYPIWRHTHAKNGQVSEATINYEMKIFRSIMAYAADKSYIKERQVPRGKIALVKVRREEFTPDEYRKLHTFARSWLQKGKTPMHAWYRTMVYDFILIMCNTGMRPTEAKNLRWRDVSVRTDDQGRHFVVLNVRGKDKHRNLVAASNVAEYLDRIRKIAKTTEPDDAVFHKWDGKPAITLYADTIDSLLDQSGLVLSSSGTRRCTYSFRHTYATFRLTEGVDVYFLAKQMGTSVKMIEDHYGHITPIKNAERILQGMPGWEPIGAALPATAETDRVNADKTKAAPAKTTGKRRKSIAKPTPSKPS
jgi:integrase